ncbi:MAG: ABC transporter ATP-binding protein [Lachnospirales bacterium]
MSEKLLEVKGMKTHFFTDAGVVKAVDGIDFSIEPGKTLGIVGESGCGKSMTSMSILRLLEHPGKTVAGEILFDGKDLLKLSEKEMRTVRGNDISIIFQEPMTSLNPIFKVGEQIMEPILLHQNLDKKQARIKAIDMLRIVGIPRPEQIVDDYPHQLSGGMRQRVMIAMALACEPKLLIADEPTTALDVTIQAQVLKIMNDLKANLNTSIMFITHDLGVIAQMADHVIVMYSGKVVEDAPVGELFKNPKHPYTIGLFNSIPDIDSEETRLESIDGKVPNPLFLPEGCNFAPRCKFVCERCLKEEPELLELTPDHKVNCFVAMEGGVTRD